MAIRIVHNDTTQDVKPAKADALDISPEEIADTLKLAGLLQTSLEMENVLEYFLGAVTQSVDFSGANYRYTPFNMDYQHGKEAHHRCNYRLRLVEEDMGELTFFRRKRFTQEEIRRLEGLIVQLIYPLRNAIWYQRAVRAAHIDPLTGINNRAAMDIGLTREIDLAHRHELPLSLLVLDVDHFKHINDAHGHSAGDYVLRTLVACISDTIRGSDMLYRYGGEEFTLILSGTSMAGASQTAERIRKAIENYPFVYDRQEIAVTVSIGIAALRTRDDSTMLFNKADNALYQAKSDGRNRIHCHRELTGKTEPA